MGDDWYEPPPTASAGFGDVGGGAVGNGISGGGGSGTGGGGGGGGGGNATGFGAPTGAQLPPQQPPQHPKQQYDFFNPAAPGPQAAGGAAYDPNAFFQQGGIGGSIGGPAPAGGGGSSGMGGGAGGMARPRENYDDEPPLLVELGINFGHIWTKTSSVLVPTKKVNEHILDDTDLAGPMFFALVLGVCLLFRGRIHFGYVYGFGAVCCIAIYVVLNLMSPQTSIDLYKVFSVLGYSLLPIVMLAALALVVDTQRGVGVAFTIGAVLWCTMCVLLVCFAIPRAWFFLRSFASVRRGAERVPDPLLSPRPRQTALLLALWWHR